MTLHGFSHENWTAAIANHLWQSTAVLLVAWLLTLVLRRNQARTRYWVWMAASLKFLLPFSLLSAIGTGLFPESLWEAKRPQLARAVANVAEPYFPSSQASVPLAVAHPSPAPAGLFLHHLGLAEVLALLWLCGSLLLIFRWSREWTELRKALKSASPVSLPFEVPSS